MIGRLATIAMTALLLSGAANPVKITSDKFIADDAQHVATFMGGVLVTRNDLKIGRAHV